MDTEFSGKRILVTGAGRGIGKAVAKQLVECGATVVALDRLQELLATLKSEIPSVEIICVDLADWNATKEAVTKAGPFDMVVNNAAIHHTAPIGKIDEESMDKLWAVNVKAPVNISQIVANSLKDRGQGGAIVNVSSQLSQTVYPQNGVYSATKSALQTITKMMALELAPFKIRCNTVNPTLVNTIMGRFLIDNPEEFSEFMKRVPLGKVCEPEEIAEAVVFLLSDKRASMVTGHSLFVDGGSAIS